nr:MAG TPA: minor tail protein [Caudoviricetes sp.]
MGVVKNLMLRVGADFSAVTTQSKKASKSMGSMMSAINRSTSKLNSAISGMNKMIGAAGIAVSLAGVVSAAKNAAAAFNEVQENNAALAQVMKNTMGATREQWRSVLDLADAQQRLGVIDAEVTKAGAVELATYLGLSDSLETLIPVMNDMLAQQYGMAASSENATNIATMLGKVMNGQTGALSRYGYSFTAAQEAILKYGDEAQRAAVLAQVVEESVGGMNQALAQTPSGRLQQVKFALGDIQEQFGKAVMTIATAFLPLLNTVAAALQKIAAWAGRVAQAIANVFGVKTKTVAAVGGGIGAAASGINKAADAGNNLSDAMGGAASSTEKAAKAAQKLGTLGFDELNMLNSPSAAADTASGGSGVSDIGDVGGGITGIDWDTLDEAGESSTALEKVLKRLKATVDKMDFSKLEAAWGRLKESAKNLGDVIGEYLVGAYEKILEPIIVWTANVLAPELTDALAAAFGSIATALDDLKPVFSAVVDEILAPLGAMLGQVVVGLLNLVAPLGEVLKGVTGIVAAFANLDFDGLLTSVETLCRGVQDLAVGAVELVRNAVDGLLDWLSGIFDGFLGGTLSGVIYEIKHLIDDILSFAQDILRTLLASVSDMINGILSIINGVLTLNWKQAWNGMLQVVKGIANAIAGLFGSVVNVIIRALNRISFTIPDWVPLIGGKHFGVNIPLFNVPQLAEGGVMQSAGLFVANENGVPEMVGRMGHHAAVANNGQIQDGIAAAVLSALLDTGMLDYVRSIADSSERTARKDFSLGRPGSEAGRWVSRSLEAYEAVRG